MGENTPLVLLAYLSPKVGLKSLLVQLSWLGYALQVLEVCPNSSVFFFGGPLDHIFT